MHGPATITGERGLQPLGPRLMEPCQVVHETPRERTDLPGGDPDTRLVLDQRTDLLSLPMPKETFHPHANHDVVADHARGQQVLGQRSAPLCHKQSATVMTTGGAHAHRLARFELPVGQGLTVAGSTLLHEPPIAAANRTNPRRLVGRNAGVGGTKDLLAAALTDRADQGPELGERIEGQPTVFFPGSSPYRVKICSTWAAVTTTPRAAKRDATIAADTKRSAP